MARKGGPTMGVLFGRSADQGFDDAYAREVHAAEGVGLVCAEVDLQRVVHDEAEEAVAQLPRARGRAWLYRGWMPPEEDYTTLYEAILARGDHLVVHPRAMAEVAYLPEWAPILGDRTPASVWTEGEDPEEAWELAATLGPPPYIVKDHLKSARHDWHRACYVPAEADKEAFLETCAALMDAHGDRFQRGFVVRRFVRLVRLPYETPGHPVFDEHRVFFWKGRPVAHAPYHDVDLPPLRRPPFPDLGRLFESPFFTADVGRLESGGFVVVELNDGGASGIPGQLDPWELYDAIARDPA